MKKFTIIIFVFLAVMAVTYFFDVQKTHRNGEITAPSESAPLENNVEPVPADIPENVPAVLLKKAGERVTKKPFGIFIEPRNSPVQPERFSGYHTGADFEILPGEENVDVAVSAVCSGRMREKRFVGGYGGVAVQDCQIENEKTTVIYGHLDLSSIKQKVGELINEKNFIGNLGNPYENETGGERKHLHLGIHKGSEINLRGYVNLKKELESWIDPCLYFCD